MSFYCEVANCDLQWHSIGNAFQQLILPTTGKMSTHFQFQSYNLYTKQM